MFETLSKVAKTLAILAGRLDPGTVSPTQAARLIKVLAQIERLVAGMRLRLSARIDTEGLFGDEGDRSGADWLGKATGQSPADAQRDIDCAKRLEQLPETDEAVRDGRLSPTQAKEVAAGAAEDRHAERELLDTAKWGSVPELRRKAKRVRASALGDD